MRQIHSVLLSLAILTQKGRHFLKLKLIDHDELKWDGRPTEAWETILILIRGRRSETTKLRSEFALKRGRVSEAVGRDGDETRSLHGRRLVV